MADLSYTYTDFKNEVAFYLGWSKDPADRDTKQEAQLDSIVQAGMRQFYKPPQLPGQNKPYRWNFLEPTTTITFWGDISTDDSVTVSGSVSDGETTLTATEDTFYPTMVGDTINITDIGSYTIISYTSATEITVDGDATCSGKTFAIPSNGNYRCPSNFGGVIGHMTFVEETQYRPIQMVGEGNIRELRQTSPKTGRPKYGATRPRQSDGANKQYWEFAIWPTPDRHYVLEYKYRARQQELSDGNPYPLGGPVHAETQLESCLYIAEQRNDDGGTGVHKNAFFRELMSSVEHDKQQGPDFFGYNSDGSTNSGSSGRHGDEHIVTVNGIEP